MRVRNGGHLWIFGGYTLVSLRAKTRKRFGLPRGEPATLWAVALLCVALRGELAKTAVSRASFLRERGENGKNPKLLVETRKIRCKHGILESPTLTLASEFGESKYCSARNIALAEFDYLLFRPLFPQLCFALSVGLFCFA